MQEFPPVNSPERRLSIQKVPVLTLFNPWKSSYEIYQFNLDGLMLARVLLGLIVESTGRRK